MDETVDLLQIQIEKAKRALPLETINAINAVDWKMAILGLRAKNGYTFEQLGDLELETELLLCGLVSPENYTKELSKRMGISGSDANDLVQEMNDLVFKKIRAELIKNTERKKIFANKSTATSENMPLPPKPLSPNPDSFIINRAENKDDAQILDSASIKIVEPALPLRTMDVRKQEPVENREDILKIVEKPEQFVPSLGPTGANREVQSILAQKLAGASQIPRVVTEHTLDNITKINTPAPNASNIVEAGELNPANIKNKIPNVDPYREVPE